MTKQNLDYPLSASSSSEPLQRLLVPRLLRSVAAQEPGQYGLRLGSRCRACTALCTICSSWRQRFRDVFYDMRLGSLDYVSKDIMPWRLFTCTKSKSAPSPCNMVHRPSTDFETREKQPVCSGLSQSSHSPPRLDEKVDLS